MCLAYGQENESVFMVKEKIRKEIPCDNLICNIKRMAYGQVKKECDSWMKGN
jgi:hypothetical protein